eukprot:jgi/Picre1/29943/NNA_005321.t1
MVTEEDVAGQKEPSTVTTAQVPLPQAKLTTALAVYILNYKKDGTPFWNLLTITPIRDETGRVVKFVGVQVDVTSTTEGHAIHDASGVPVLINYDDRLKENVAKPIVDDVLHAVQAGEGKTPKRLSRQSGAGEEVLGRNCRFLQGKHTDRSTVDTLKKAIKEQREITVRLLNYKKDGTPFWNMLTVAPIRDVSGAPRFLVGVQVDVTEESTVEKAAPLGMKAAHDVGNALKRVDWVGLDPWASFTNTVLPLKPHRRQDSGGVSIQKLQHDKGKIKLSDFRRRKQLGTGDVGMVDLVAMDGHQFAMKSLEKQEMIDRNKVGRVRTEQKILETIDHPFLSTCYAKLKTDTHLHFILEYCSGGELYGLMNRMPGKRLPEAWVKFYAAEVLMALQYLHLNGFMYRDLKPENILIHESGHIKLTDFDLSWCQGETIPSVEKIHVPRSATDIENGLSPEREDYIIKIKPKGRANSFVGTEEYLAPEIITGQGHDYMFPTLEPPMSDECKDLLKSLLRKDPEDRLGHEAGAEDVKRHPWFHDIDWSLLANSKPPYIPGETPKLPEKEMKTTTSTSPTVEGF